MDAQGNAVEVEDFYDADGRGYYCKHGVFVGNPFGGDYLCGYCESGISDADFQAMIEERVREARGAEVFKAAMLWAMFAMRLHERVWGTKVWNDSDELNEAVIGYVKVDWADDMYETVLGEEVRMY